MIIVFWIALFGIIGTIGVVVGSIVKTKLMPRWGIVPTDHLQKKEVSIDAAGNHYRGFLYTSTDFNDSPPMPGMVLLPRRGIKYPAFEHWAAAFAMQGLPTLAVELNDKKSPVKEFVESITVAWPNFKVALTKNAKVEPSSIGVLGFGEAALAGLYAGGPDAAVKILSCAGMPPVDPTRVKDPNGKVALVHCKDDAVAPFDDFTFNKEKLGIGNQDYVILELGGHDFISQEAVLVGFFSIKAHKALAPRYKQFTPAGVVMP